VQAARADGGTGVGANCEIPHAGHRGSIGDIGTAQVFTTNTLTSSPALIVVSALSVIMSLVLILLASRRKAAVGRVEMRI
jgi:hypothetical protein